MPQFHTPPDMNIGVAPVGPENPGNNALEEWDGCAVFELESLERFEAAFKDPYYIDTIEPDERNFVNKKEGIMGARGRVKTIV